MPFSEITMFIHSLRKPWSWNKYKHCNRFLGKTNVYMVTESVFLVAGIEYHFSVTFFRLTIKGRRFQCPVDKWDIPCYSPLSKVFYCHTLANPSQGIKQMDSRCHSHENSNSPLNTNYALIGEKKHILRQ